MDIAPGTSEERAAIRTALGQAARNGQLVTYRDLAAAAGILPPHSIHRLTLMLEDLMRDDAASGRPLLAALAVSRRPPRMPRPGFFQLLRSLGRYDGQDHGPTAEAAHASETARVWAAWRDQPVAEA